jgi:TP901 family phage tail tape measure protein
MNLFNLVAKLTLDSSEYDRAMAAAKGTAVKSGDSMVASVNKTKKAIGVAALGMGAAMAAFGVSSVKTGMEFDSSMSQVAATMGYSVDEINDKTSEAGKTFDQLRNFAQEMGKNTKFSATESADALNYMALAGYDAEKSMRMLPNVLNLAAAGNIDLAAASDMVTDASSALGLTEAETTKMIDQMAAAASKSNTSVEQLGQAILTVGGTAKVLKGGTTELSTALGILADNGTKGAEGGTALRNVLTSIQGGKFEKTFGELGVQAYDAQGNLRSLKDIFLDMGDAMEGMTDEERTDIINKTFNARDLKNVNALLGTSAERWDELTGAIDNSTGAAEKMADTQLDNLAGDITLLQSAFEGLKISVSDKLTPVFRGLVQFLTWCIDHASTLGPIILGLATAFGVFAVAINIGSIIQSVTTAFAAFNAILAANPIGLVIAVIAGLIVAIVALWKNNETFRNKVTAVWNAVRSKISGAISGIKSAFGSLKSAVATVRATFDNIKNAISNKIEAAKQKVKNVIDKIKGYFPFSVGKIFSGWIPKIKLWTSKGKDNAETQSSTGRTNFAKAMSQPYMFKRPTEFYAGEAGDEMLYGKSALMHDMREAVSGVTTGQNVQITNYITVEGAESPEDFAERFVRKMKLDMRAI